MASVGVYTSLVLVFLALCYTRFSTGSRSTTPHRANAQEVTRVPYWVPGLGHALSLLSDADRFIRRTSQQLPKAKIFSLQVLGSRWNIIANRALCEAVLQQPEGVVDASSVLWSYLCRAFGAEAKQQQRFESIDRELQTSFSQDSRHGSLIATIIRNIPAQAPNLVSFSASIVDQNLWERLSHTSTIEDQTVETEFFTLIQRFTAYSTLIALLGTDFMVVYPGILEDLTDLDKGMKYLILGIPRWFPIPSLIKVSAARRRLDNAIDAFHHALDRAAVGEEPQEPWRDLSDVSDLIKQRSALYRDHSAPPGLKGPLDLHLIWFITTKITPLVPWLLLRILSSPNVLNQIRSEIGPFVKVVQPPRPFGIAEPPRLQQLDIDGLAHSCPILKACFYETVRLDTSPVSLRIVQKTFTLVEPQRATLRNEPPPPAYSLRAGEHVAMTWSLHHQDPNIFDAPLSFRPERFLVPEGSGMGKTGETARPLDIVMPWWSDSQVVLGSGEDPVEKTVLAFVTGLLAMWDFEPAESEGWPVPGHRRLPNYMEPSRDIRSRVRPLAMEPIN